MMTLKSIELFGFKSFGKKSIISFTTPVTSIVGPNGSGKSNIVEAMRFVLGEQSIKSLRSKGGVDLIYKGSKSLAPSSRASVTIVFDNSEKIFSFTNSGLGVSLDYDEVSVARTVYPDGVNKYSINGTEVRLKDVVDLLASVNIGSSGHHIISQGEADRVLNASNKDRRTMIEDALGLKVFQYRINESERKLEKTVTNMKEVGISRREVAPHLSFLKKQVAKVEKAYEMRQELQDLYKKYFSFESVYIQKENERLSHLRRTLDESIVSLDDRIIALERMKEDEVKDESSLSVISDYELSLNEIRNTKDEQVRALGRIEGVIEGINRELSRVSVSKERVVSSSEWRSVISRIENYINDALGSSDINQVFSILSSIKEHIKNVSVFEEESKIDESIVKERDDLVESKKVILSKIEDLKNTEQIILSQIQEEKNKEKEKENSRRDSQFVLFDLQRQKTELAGELRGLSFQEEKLSLIKNSFEAELAEGAVLIGRDVLDYVKNIPEVEFSRNEIDDIRRRVERIKIKLEDTGVANASEIMKEYQDVVERDLFLEKEILDLQKSIESLHLLIADLKETLDTQFKDGVEKINYQFQEFFALMFGGGSAFLSVVMEHKKTRKSKNTDEEINEEKEEENDIGFERGIEINVTLPQKKVKDLHMLSGGERSLTSIALLFAISQVNPPPFLVLDETDAALDEANSRRYGDMLKNLSAYSQLVVVTHNRETMSHAQVLYGVTVGSDGASKLLSIKLEDASVYAK